MEITAILSQENETLPKAELEARLQTLEIPYDIHEEYLGLIQLEVDATEEQVIELGNHLSYTQEIIKTLNKTSPEKLNEAYKEINWVDVLDDSYKVRVKKMNQGSVHRDITEREIGGYIKQQTNLPVSLNNPVYTVRIVYTDPSQTTNEHKEVSTVKYNRIMIGISLVKLNKKHFFENKPHKRPYFHPGSMSPKLALCMVNLAHTHKGDTVWDPFCGTGGILIEAGLLGTRVIGSDIERDMANGTKLNLEHENLTDYLVEQVDARNMKFYEKVDAVAMDPPYGISTTMGGEDTKELYHGSLVAISEKLKKDGRICMASPHYIDMYEVIEGTDLEILQQHSIRMHKSLTRIITVLKHKNLN